MLKRRKLRLSKIDKIQGIFFEGWRTFCERRQYGLRSTGNMAHGDSTVK